MVHNKSLERGSSLKQALLCCLFLMVATNAFQRDHLVTQRGMSSNKPLCRIEKTNEGVACRMSIFDTLSSMTGIPPSDPILNTKKPLLKSILSQTYLANSIDSVECVYKASKDGWSAVDFHDRVDDKGSGIVVALSRSGALIGGFNPQGWRSTDDYYLSNEAFLWHQNGNSVVKSAIYPGGSTSLFDYATGGPCFGSGDLVIGEPKAAIMGGFAGPDMENVAANSGSLKNGKCAFSGSYDISNKWPVKGAFQLVEVEVYCRSPSKKKSKGWF